MAAKKAKPAAKPTPKKAKPAKKPAKAKGKGPVTKTTTTTTTAIRPGTPASRRRSPSTGTRIRNMDWGTVRNWILLILLAILVPIGIVAWVLRNQNAEEQNVSCKPNTNPLPGFTTRPADKGAEQRREPPQMAQTPPATIINNINNSNYTKVEVENSPGAHVDVNAGNTVISAAVAVSSGGAPVLANSGSIDWREQTPSRRVNMGESGLVELRPGEVVRGIIPTDWNVRPVPDGLVPVNALEILPDNCNAGYDRELDTYNGTSIVRMRISPDWHGGPFTVHWHETPSGPHFREGYGHHSPYAMNDRGPRGGNYYGNVGGGFHEGGSHGGFHGGGGFHR